jgi:hypothetical protein
MLYKVLGLWNNTEQYGTIQPRFRAGNSPGKSSPFALNYHHFGRVSLALGLGLAPSSPIASPSLLLLDLLALPIKLSSTRKTGHKKNPGINPGQKGN